MIRLTTTAAVIAIALSGCSNYPPGVYNAVVPGPTDRAWLSEDKGAHAAAGLIASAVVAIAAKAAGASDKEAANAGCAGAIVTGIGKELYDYHMPMGNYAPGTGYWETADAVFTGGAGCLPRIIMEF